MTATFRPELVPTWAKVAAWAVPLTTIPSIAWRMISLIDGLVSGDDPCFTPAAPLGEKLYLLAVLPSVQLGLALLTVGLIRPWGEVFPRWMPALGGRQIPVAVAVGVAAAAAVLVGVWLGIGVVMDLLGGHRAPLYPVPPECPVPGWDVLRWYTPMFLWPLLLLAVTWHYLRRRRISPSVAQPTTHVETEGPTARLPASD
jgi:hypothetical protein